MNDGLDDTQDPQVTPPILAGLATFKVKFDASSNTQSGPFYANGRMQIKVQVLVSGVDADGNPAHVPAEVMESIELVHYATGRKLRDGWVASAEQGRFTIEARPAVTAVDGRDEELENDGVHPQVRTFWVSSSSAGTTQIGARLSVNGQRILSNGTTLSSVHDSCVTIEARTPVTYHPGLFHWYQSRRGNEEPGNRIWNYYLGLYPSGTQIKLVDWIVDGKEADVDIVFARGNKLNEIRTNYMLATLVRPERKKLDVFLPYRGNSIAYTFYSDAIARDKKHYSVRVNDRDGELTITQALSEYSEIAPKSRKDDDLYVRVIDEFGTEHKLSIRVNFYERNIYLDRG